MISTYEEKTMGKKRRNRSLPLKAKVANHHRLQQSKCCRSERCWKRRIPPSSVSQGDERERTADDVSKRIPSSSNSGFRFLLRDEAWKMPLSCPISVRHEGGMTLVKALVRSVETCYPYARDSAQGAVNFTSKRKIYKTA